MMDASETLASSHPGYMPHVHLDTVPDIIPAQVLPQSHL